MEAVHRREFAEDDEVGRKTLELISNADSFNRWMFDTIKPFLNGKVLEIGSGIGNISEFLLRDGFECYLSDKREDYCETLRARFGENPLTMGVGPIDLVDVDFESRYRQHLGRYDTVFALNVIEHIHDDVLALRNCHKMLKGGGRLLVLVPSYQILYNRFDSCLGHYRRYTAATMAQVFRDAGFEVAHTRYFNFVGIFGWILSGGILRYDTIPEGQMRIFKVLVPMVRMIDRLLLNSVGLSTIVVGDKK
jgi:2-polyprenyl-3-methyl-5-hydroxy-6-metoxy-1,4-benzoquinol methylase